VIQDCDTLDLIWLSAAGETAPAILQHGAKFESGTKSASVRLTAPKISNVRTSDHDRGRKRINQCQCERSPRTNFRRRITDMGLADAGIPLATAGLVHLADIVELLVTE